MSVGNLSKHSQHVIYLCCALMLFSTLGCQFAPKQTTSVWPWKSEEKKILPDRILPVWTDTVLHQPGQPGVRGFGGRIYFYGKENTNPVEVDGNLAVYVFDADDDMPSDQKPLRKFVFTADQFKTHMSKSTIGPSYSVWIPWGEVGGVPRRLSLIARFEGRDGGTTISDSTIKMLPGVPANKQDIAKTESPATNSASAVSLAGHTDVLKPSSKKKSEDEASDVESIDLPPDFQRHLRVPPPKLSVPATAPSQSNSPAAAIPSKLESKIAETVGEREAVETEVESAEAKEVAPITTQVFDLRTRGKQGSSRQGYITPFHSRSNKTDIREGRWIQSISRSDKKNKSE